MDFSMITQTASGLLVYVPNFGLWGGLAALFIVLLVLVSFIKGAGIWLQAVLLIAAALSLAKAMGLF